MTSAAISPREDALISALAQLDPELRRHNTDVARLCVTVGLQLRLEPHRLQLLAQAAVVHDIGKAYIPQAILNKPGPLDDDEWQLMKQHTIRGETLLLRVPGFTEVARIVRSSHENWDGSGYPDSLAGTQIPFEARIIAVCDAYDAITTDRPYRRKRDSCEAVYELERSAGCQFDPAVVMALSDLQKIHADLRNASEIEPPHKAALIRVLGDERPPRQILGLTRPGREPRSDGYPVRADCVGYRAS